MVYTNNRHAEAVCKPERPEHLRKADVVVVNADTPWAYKNLLKSVQAGCAISGRECRPGRNHHVHQGLSASRCTQRSFLTSVISD